MNKSDTNLRSLQRLSYCGIIGLHPHKDVLLLDISGTAVAYHLATSRMQYLRYGLNREPGNTCAVEGAYPYRPCDVDVLPIGKISYPTSVLNWYKLIEGTYHPMKFVQSS